jgi:hypothetical protein
VICSFLKCDIRLPLVHQKQNSLSSVNTYLLCRDINEKDMLIEIYEDVLVLLMRGYLLSRQIYKMSLYQSFITVTLQKSRFYLSLTGKHQVRPYDKLRQ